MNIGGNVIRKTDILIVGTGCAGLYCALHLPKDRSILMITKSDAKSSDSYLAQGGICMLRNEADYDSFFYDTMKSGHFENDQEAVEIMIRSSPSVIRDLVSYGVLFDRGPHGEFSYTKEGAHSERRILYHKDITGEEITRKLLVAVKRLPNVDILEHTTMVDLVCIENGCCGAVVRAQNGENRTICSNYTVLATGGIGGLYAHSTNWRHLTGDAVAVALKHNIECKDLNYIQIHPTTLYSDKKEDRSFLISESVRGEGAKLYDKNMHRFVDELLPRDRLTEKILLQMEKDQTKFVWEDLRGIPAKELTEHFPNIVEHCRKMGYDVTEECIPVVSAQHYYMGGIKVTHNGKSSMERLYAIGETACTGVHGRNRLASNSLLESLVFAKRSAVEIGESFSSSYANEVACKKYDLSKCADFKTLSKEYRQLVLEKIAELDNRKTKRFPQEENSKDV
ncbi:MAG: L-aspartate oxidase [Anaerovoracaceae bacterium]